MKNLRSFSILPGGLDVSSQPGAQSLARDIQSARTTAVGTLESLIERIEVEQPKLNCFVTLNYENARSEAKLLDAETKRNQCRGPLHGVPIAIKDSWATRGLRTTNGFTGTEKYVPDFDATIVERLKAAGAIVIGKTNLSTLAMDIQSDNPVSGRTNNPHDRTRTAGGSSGGAACAVAAGLAPLDIGSDIGGSIRIPAHYCGVIGLKPTENAVSLHGHLPGLQDPQYIALRNLASAGPLARNFADLRLAFDLIRGPDPRDPKIAPVAAIKKPSTTGRRMRIAVLPAIPDRPLDAEYQSLFVNFVEQLRRDSSCDIIELRQAPLDFDRIGTLWGKLLNAGLAPRTPPLSRVAMELMTRFSKRRPAGSEQILPLTYGDFMRVFTERDRHIENFEAWFAGINSVDDQGFDALIAPVTATPAFRHRKPDRVVGVANIYAAPVELRTPDGATFSQEYYRAHTGFTIPFNLLGNPVVTIPAGSTGSGLPVGVQIIGPRWSDLRLLDIAERIHRQAAT